MATETKVYDAAADLAVLNEGKAGGLSFNDAAQIIAGAKELPDSEVDMLAIMGQIVGATSIEEGLGERTADALESHIGEQIVVNDFRLNRSDEKFGKGVYAAIDCVTADGERKILTTGAGRVLAGLVLMLKLGTWGQTYRITSKPGAKGNIYSLVLVPKSEPVTLDDGSTF